jgi:ribosomal protein S18 acetylase RimI-like enzyme
MTNILNDFSKQSLKEAVINNMLDYCRFRAKTPRVTILETEEIFRYDVGFTSFAMQGVCYTNLKPDKVNQKIEEVVEYFTSRNMPLIWIHTPGITKPENMEDYLEAHSFKKMGVSPGMAVDLEKIIDDRPTPPGLTIQQVDNEELNRVFWKVWSKGYPMPDDYAAFEAYVSEYVGFHPDNPQKLFLGLLDGESVATSQLFLGGGVAGLWGVTTLQKARGKGVGTAMSLHPLRVARSLGYRVAVLDSTQQGIGIYRRLGFEEVCLPVYYTYQSPSQGSADDKLKDVMLSKRT